MSTIAVILNLIDDALDENTRVMSWAGTSDQLDDRVASTTTTPGCASTRRTRLARAMASVVIVVVAAAALLVSSSQPVAASTGCGAVYAGKATGQWLGGLGVDVRSNGRYNGTGSSCAGYVKNLQASAPQWGNGWQCVELVNRLYKMRDWISVDWSGHGYQKYDNAPANLSKEPQGSVRYIAPGDVVVFNRNFGAYGHVAVATEMGTIVSQNMGDANVEWPIALAGGTVTVPGKVAANKITGVVHSPVTPRSPSVAVLPSGQQDVFYRGTDGGLWAAVWNNGWKGPFKIAHGPLGSAPTVAYNAALKQENIFWKGTDNKLWGMTQNMTNGTWIGPLNIGVTLGSDPSVAVLPSGQQDVFYRGTDGGLWAAVWNNGWKGPFKIAHGRLGSAPTVAYNAALKQENIFWKGTDNKLWGMTQNMTNGTWIGPLNIGVTLGSDPSVAVLPSGQQDVFYRGTDGGLWAAVWNNGWKGPFKIAHGPLGSAPTVAYNAALKQENIFWKGTDTKLWGMTQNMTNGTWIGPLNIGMGPLV